MARLWLMLLILLTPLPTWAQQAALVFDDTTVGPPNGG
jgi:hypothetical protein